MMLIDEVNFTVKTRNALLRNNIKYLEELENYSIKEVKNFRWIGKESLKEIEDILNDNGLTFRKSTFCTVDDEINWLNGAISIALEKIKYEKQIIKKAKKRLKEIENAREGS